MPHDQGRDRPRYCNSFDDTTADSGTTYYYRVTAVLDAAGSISPPSTEAWYTTGGVAHDQIADGSFESPRVGIYGDQWGPTNGGPQNVQRRFRPRKLGKGKEKGPLLTRGGYGGQGRTRPGTIDGWLQPGDTVNPQIRDGPALNAGASTVP